MRTEAHEPRRLLDMPERQVDDFKGLHRKMVILSLMRGVSEDEIYRKRIDIAVQAARLEGCDESDVEVIASQARRNVADILAECRESGINWEVS